MTSRVTRVGWTKPPNQVCTDRGRGAPQYFQICKIVKRQPCCKRVSNSIFCDLFFFLGTIVVGQLVKTPPPQQKVSRQITAPNPRNLLTQLLGRNRAQVKNHCYKVLSHFYYYFPSTNEKADRNEYNTFNHFYYYFPSTNERQIGTNTIPSTTSIIIFPLPMKRQIGTSTIPSATSIIIFPLPMKRQIGTNTILSSHF